MIAVLFACGTCRRAVRIRDGSLVKEKELPSLVVFLRNGRVTFTGNLVAGKSVLTAGHNLNQIAQGDSLDNYQVLIGAHDIRKVSMQLWN